MRISPTALLLALADEEALPPPGADRFRPLLELALSLSRAERAILMLWTPQSDLEFHSSQFVDQATQESLDKLALALRREWSNQAFALFTPASVSPEFANGILRRRPLRRAPFLCLMLSDGQRLLGILFLDGGQVTEAARDSGMSPLDPFQRLSAVLLAGEDRGRRLASLQQTLLARLRKTPLEELEKEGIIRCLKKNLGNIAKTHVELRIPRMSFYHKLRRYRIRPQTYRKTAS